MGFVGRIKTEHSVRSRTDTGGVSFVSDDGKSPVPPNPHRRATWRQVGKLPVWEISHSLPNLGLSTAFSAYSIYSFHRQTF